MDIAQRYFIVHKPAGMVSQFVSPHRVRLLDALGFDFPPGTHAVGRLDADSEGLLLLTTNKKITKLLFESETPHRRTYLVRVKNRVSAETALHLSRGIQIPVKSGNPYLTAPCRVEIIPPPDQFSLPGEREAEENGRYSWLRMTLTEGKFRQVRKMVYAAGHTCRRLIRVSIEDLCIGDLGPGEVREVSEEFFFGKLRLRQD